MIQVRRFKYDFDNLNDLMLLDPRLIVGITVFPNEVRVIALNRLFSLQKKVTIILGETSWMNGGIKIKSVQSNNDFLIVETDGPMCSSVKIAVKKVLQAMKYMACKNAFFPGEDVLKSVGDSCLFYAGENIDSLKLVDSFLTSIRLMSNYLLFYCQRDGLIKKLRLKDVTCDWSVNAFGLCRLKNVVFLGREKGDVIPVTLADGKIINIDLFSGRVLSENRALEESGIFIGESEGINTLMVADKLIFSPIRTN